MPGPCKIRVIVVAGKLRPSSIRSGSGYRGRSPESYFRVIIPSPTIPPWVRITDSLA